MPQRSFDYWEGKLEAAYAKLAQLQSQAEGIFPKYPVKEKGTPVYHKLLDNWRLDCQMKRKLKYLIRMYQETKIPYYESRLLALRRPALDRVVGEDDWLIL
jgi:hypothetical protein